MWTSRWWKRVVGAASAAAVVVLVLGPGEVGHAQTEVKTQWSLPKNLGRPINTRSNEDLPHFSADGSSLYFASDRVTEDSLGNFDIWVSQKDLFTGAWGAPVNLGSVINTAGDERGPCLSRDGHYLYFSSTGRPDGFGGPDLYRSYRPNIHNPQGWQQAVNLGPGVNTIDADFGAALLGSDGSLLSPPPALLFGRRPLPLGTGDSDIYMSEFLDGTFRTAQVVTELSSEFDDLRPTIRGDGLMLMFNSNRQPGSALNDLWVSTRPDVNSPWSTPRNAGPTLNSAYDDQFPALSFNGNTVVFSSRRAGTGDTDLYISTREVAIHSFP